MFTNMKKLLLISITLFFISQTYGQITNIKSGNWSDNTVWSNNTVPNVYDDVLLDFDVVVDINAACQSLTTNGHNITINTGANLNITGNSADTLLSRFVIIDTSAINPLDTTLIIDFSYDQYKRNTVINTQFYTDGIVSEVYDTKFLYKDSSRLPLKKMLVRVFPDSSGGSTTTYLYFQNLRLVADSAVFPTATMVRNFTYRPDAIIATEYDYFESIPEILVDSVKVEYLNGDIVKQANMNMEFGLGVSNFVFNSHPNPFYYIQNKFAVSNDYPAYPLGTTIERVYGKTNPLSITQSYDVVNLESYFDYEYKSNGYPKTVSISSTDLNGKGFYYYSH